jgi:NAD(P)H-hydrate epimerase
VAGSLGYHGAAVLAARGAQSARPGLISVITTDEAYPAVAAQLQAAMVRPWTSDWEPPAKASAILFGPGLADPTVPTGLRRQMIQLWENFDGAMVADASGMDWLQGIGTAGTGYRVVTPHPGESARLLGTSAVEVQRDRLEALRRLSDRLNGVEVVLKGYQTIIGYAGGNVFINSTGGPSLGQGGSGDVLAGYIAGLLAQPALRADPVVAVRYAVWRHGLAGESPRWSGRIEDLPTILATPPDFEQPPPIGRR